MALVPKILGALEITDNRPIVRLCAQLLVFLKTLSKNLYRDMEDYKLVDNVQEGIRRFRSTKRQLSKINGVLAGQRRRKTGLSVILYWLRIIE